MFARATVVVAAAVAVVFVGSPAGAKGPDRATITATAMAQPIVLAGHVDAAGRLTRLAEGTGLFVAMFGPSDDGVELQRTAPTKRLGPYFTVDYRVPTGEAKPAMVRQEIYPYAAGGAVTHTRAGQDGMSGPVYSGWYAVPRGFAALFHQLGLRKAAGTPMGAPEPVPGSTAGGTAVPQPAASTSDRGDDGTASLLWLLVGGVIVVGLGAGVLRRRRTRPGH